MQDDLTHGPPARVMGLAAIDEETCQRLGDDRGLGLAAVRVQVTQRLRDPAAVLDRPRKLTRCALRLA